MSAAVLDHVLKTSTASGAARLALVVLASIADDDGAVEASYTDLALLLNCHRRSAIRAVQPLLDSGEIERVKSPSGNGNSYKICLCSGDDTVTTASDDIVTPPVTILSPPKDILPSSEVTVTKVSIDKISKTPPPISPPTISKVKRKTQIPDNWEPSQHALEIANTEGYSDDEKEFILAQFKDSAVAHDRRYANWNRAFYNWLRSGYTQSDIQNRRRLGNQKSVEGPGSGQLIAAGRRFLARREA